MNVKKLLSFFLFLLFSHSLLAQTGKITGFVTDTEGEPLPGVNVVIEGTTQGTATSADGYYQILNVQPGTYNLRASFVGFAPVVVEDVEVSISLTTEVNIEMMEQTFEGEEVTVVAEQPVVKKDVSSSQASISRENLESLPITSVTSAIGLQAGMEGLSVRGSGTDEVAFNFNGFTLRSERNNTPFTGVSLTSVENVQVQTGGFNAEYGNIRSGVVNVTGKEGKRDRYTLDGIVRITPPQSKNIGQRVNSPDSYWLRPYLDDDVAWEGTNRGEWNEQGEWVGGPWDEYTQREYPEFEGWNAVSQRTLADDDPDNDITPQAAQEAFKWQHRKDMAIKDPDYEIDLTLGGPVPFVSEKLGDLRFSTSFRETQTMYFIPLSEDRYKQTTFQAKLTSNVAPGMKLSFDGLYSKQRGTGASQSGNPGFFVSPSGIASNMSRISYIESRIYASDFWAPSEEVNANIGAQFTHSLSNNTFYEVKVNNFINTNSTNPGRYRNTDPVVSFGGVPFNEAPFGFYDATAEGIGSGMRMGVGMSTSRDSSKVSTFTVNASITSQLDRLNQVKAGIEFVRTHSQINYGSFDKGLPAGRTKSKWDTKPIRMAAFIQDKLEFKGMIANLGLRLTYSDPNIDWYDYDVFSDIFSSGGYSSLDTVSTSNVKPQVVLQPRLGVSFPITDDSKLFFNYGHFVQLPSPENLYLVRVEPFTDKIVRMAVPENSLPKTVAYEIGFEQSLFDSYLVRLSGYYKDLSQQPIQVSFTGGPNEDSHTESRPYSYADIRGFELTLRKQPAKFFWGEINYTYSVRSSGYFGTLENYENPFQQREYERTTTANNITRPIPQPYARLQLYFMVPREFGPKLGGIKPLANWQISSIISWRAGSYTTYTDRQALEDVRYNLQLRDYWGTSLRFSRNFNIGENSRINVFADISNVINRQTLSLSSGGFMPGEDYNDYLSSLHLPKGKLKEINRLDSRVPGNDRIGDYRKHGTTFVPIEAYSDFSLISNPNNRALYYNTEEGKYYQFNGSFVEADSKYVKKVLDKKAYINMPDQRFFNFLNPRTIQFGIRFSF